MTEHDKNKLNAFENCINWNATFVEKYTRIAIEVTRN